MQQCKGGSDPERSFLPDTLKNIFIIEILISKMNINIYIDNSLYFTSTLHCYESLFYVEKSRKRQQRLLYD